jgi:sigma-B regulation protein RsbU (phosphoserine phosphatase)
LVPAIAFGNGRIEVLGASAPSTEMGGDLIDVVDHGEATDLFVADVSGHGVRAGVVMGMVKSAIRMGLRAPVDLARLAGELNDVLEGTTSPELYATLAAVRIHGSGQVEYALAGHHHIAHCRPAPARVERLGHRTFPLGLFRGRTYEVHSTALEPGDLLAIYTDGLPETADGDEQELGHEPIERTLAAMVSRPLPEIRDALFDLVSRHGAQADDRTLLLVRFGAAR